MIVNLKGYLPNYIKREVKTLFGNLFDSLKYFFVSRMNLSIKRTINERNISSIIFICKGNICRSIFADKRLRNLLRHTNIIVDSCGIDVDQGNMPPKESLKIASEYACSLGGHKAKGLDKCDIKKADLILPMEYWQYKRLVQLYPDKKENILLLRTFASFPYSFICNVVDPYGWGIEEFRRCYKIIDCALHGLVEKL